jgi:hypothetical protein
MRSAHNRVARLELSRDRRDDFTALVGSILTYVADHAETYASYLLISAFWGLVVYVALVYSLP